ncbi:MAG TPA: hypothetical protein ENI23_15185 [bacterium]|nr:hypothetical protein [bacterium]
MKTCPRSNCKNKANQSPTFGILPCDSCINNDTKLNLSRKYQFASLNKLHRIQSQRDGDIKGLEQPYIANKANKKFFTMYPELVKTYDVEEELKKL